MSDLDEYKESKRLDMLQRSHELLDYAMVRLEYDEDVHGNDPEVVESCMRLSVAAMREAADIFEHEVINNDEFWQEFKEAMDNDDDTDDNQPYWGGSNEQN